MIEDMRMVKISSKRQITIPKSCKAFGEGDRALLISNGDVLMLRPMTEDLEPALWSQSALAKDWLSEADEEAYKHLQDEKE